MLGQKPKYKGGRVMRKNVAVVAVILLVTASLALARGPVANPVDPIGEVNLSKPIIPPTVETEVCTVYVDDDYDYSTPGFGYDHFNRIQEAINMVCASCTGNKMVVIYEGTYFRAWGFDNGAGNYDSTDTEPINIWCDDILVTGGSNPVIMTVVDSPYDYATNSGITMINVDGNNVTIKKLHIKGKTGSDSWYSTFAMAKRGIMAVDDTSLTVEYVYVDSCVSGIAVANVPNFEAHYDTLVDCGIDGARGSSIFYWGGATTGNAYGNYIVSNRTDAFFMPIGIMFHLGASGSAYDNTILNMGYGVGVNSNDQTTYVGDNNVITNAQIAVQMLNYHADVHVMNNTLSIGTSGDRGPYDVVDVLGTSSSTPSVYIHGNVIEGDSVASNMVWGVYLTDWFYWGIGFPSLVEVFENDIKKNYYGIYVDAFGSRATPFYIHNNNIFHNTADGVFIQDALVDTFPMYSGPDTVSVAPTNVKISQNSMYENAELGIDLAVAGESAPGVTDNDTPYVTDPDDGPNTLYNFPVITGAVNVSGTWQLTGYAHPGDFVEIYEADGDLSGYGEGKVYKTTVTASPSGGFLAWVTGTFPFTALSIDPSTGNTSEFGLNISTPTEVSENVVIRDIPAAFEVLSNPVKDRAYFRFALKENSKVTIKIYDASGKLVRNLFVGNLERGGYKLSWDRTDNHGKRLPEGIYFVSFKTKGFSATKKLVMAE